MATFFDLITRPNESIKSKTTGKFIQLSKPPEDLKVSNDWDVKIGDVLFWSEYRTTETYFVTPEKTLLKNPDTSRAGYLTIPLSITSLFPDAVQHFSSVLDAIGRNYVTSIELLPTDAFFVKHFSKEPLPTSIKNRNDILYSYDPNEEYLYVTVSSNPDQTQYFPLDTTKTNDIIEWISVANEPRAKFNVKFNFQGKEICSKVPRGSVNGLPIGWQCEQKGGATRGDDHIQGEWKCQGPEKTKDNAKKTIENFYKGLNIEII